MKRIANIIFIVMVGLAAFYYKDKLQNIWRQSYNYYFPCKSPITYSIGTFDTRFGISEQDFLSAMSQAEKIWESPISKDLFKYDPEGFLKVNLIYDTRQDTTVQLKNMGIVVQNNKASYDELKAKYISLNNQYLQEKSALQGKISDFNSRRAEYEAEVTAVNKRGGANKDTYNRLNAEKNELNQEANVINQMQVNLNSKVDDINALGAALNDLATKLNIDVNKYNNIGGNLGGEFDEGLYKSSSDGQEIDIYQFDNQTKLVRVLAHELGHALGLDHVDDPKAIMYRLNNGVNEKLTATDLTELKNLCGVK